MSMMSTYHKGQEILVKWGGHIYPAIIREVRRYGKYRIHWVDSGFDDDIITSDDIFTETKRARTETKLFIKQHQAPQPAKTTGTKKRATTKSTPKGKRSRYPTNKIPQIGDSFLKEFYKDKTETDLVECEGLVVSELFGEYQ